jgi:hypothetical protein
VWLCPNTHVFTKTDNELDFVPSLYFAYSCPILLNVSVHGSNTDAKFLELFLFFNDA